jgi:acetylornithine deacetylase
MCDALTAVKGKAEPYSICGSLPLVDQLQKAGFGSLPCSAPSLALSVSDPPRDLPPFRFVHAVPCALYTTHHTRADVQLCGFGLSSTYHADNEYALLSDMKDGYQVFCRILGALNAL